VITAIIKLLGVSKNSYWNYKKQDRPIITFLEKYFTEEEIVEFLDTGSMQKLEDTNKFVQNVKLENELFEKHIAYGLQYKFRNDREGSFLNWLSHVAGKKYLKEIVLDIQKGEYSMADTKEKILSQISGMEKTTEFNILVAKLKKGDLSSYIRRSLSELECYVLVKHYNIVMDHTKYFSKS